MGVKSLGYCNRTPVTVRWPQSRAGKSQHSESAASRPGRTRGRSVLALDGGPDSWEMQPDPGDGPVVAWQGGKAPPPRQRNQQARPHPRKKCAVAR